MIPKNNTSIAIKYYMKKKNRVVYIKSRKLVFFSQKKKIHTKKLIEKLKFTTLTDR